MLPFFFRPSPAFHPCGHLPFDPEFPGGPPPHAFSSPDDEVPEDNPRIPHPATSDQHSDEPPAIATWARPLPPMYLLQTAYLDIMRHLTSVPPEAGGMLLGPKGSSVVTHYVIDKQGTATAASFTLDAIGLNRVLRKRLECGLDCKGLVHSHPPGCNRPSSGDLSYVRKSFANENNKNLTEFLLPIFCGGVLIPYLIRPRAENVVQIAQLMLF